MFTIYFTQEMKVVRNVRRLYDAISACQRKHVFYFDKSTWGFSLTAIYTTFNWFNCSQITEWYNHVFDFSVENSHPNIIVKTILKTVQLKMCTTVINETSKTVVSKICCWWNQLYTKNTKLFLWWLTYCLGARNSGG